MKKISFNLLLITFILAIKTISAQTDDQINRYYNAEDLLEDSNFKDALAIYEQLSEEVPDNPNLNFKIGYCYLKSARNKEKSMSYLEYAYKYVNKNIVGFDKKSAPLEAMYYLGRSYQMNYKFIEAKTIYTSLIDSLDSKEEDFISLINHRIKNCDYARDLVAKPLTVKITNLGPEVNSEYDDYSPLVSSDGSRIIFTSKRKGSTGGKEMENGEYYEDIYETKFDGSSYAAVTKLSTSLNTNEHEAAVYLSEDDKVLLIYKDDNGAGNLYRSNLIKGEWSAPTQLPKIVNSKSKETHASLDAVNNVFYFTSDRKGGYGGLDIYKSEQDADGNWTKAENLGPTINTSYDEDGVYYYNGNGPKLIFSSRGHHGMGGFDIFVSSLNDNGSWGEPKNIGYPINTPDDNIFVSVTADAKLAYFSSRSRGGFGGYDLYRVDLIPEPATVVEKEPVVVEVAAVVLEADEKVDEKQSVEEKVVPVKPKPEPTPNIKVEKEERTIFTAHKAVATEQVPGVVEEKKSKKGLFAIIGGILMIIIVLFSRRKKKN